MNKKLSILKNAMSVDYCGSTRFDYLDSDEKPLIYEAMQQYSDFENKELKEQRDELLKGQELFHSFLKAFPIEGMTTQELSLLVAIENKYEEISGKQD